MHDLAPILTIAGLGLTLIGLLVGFATLHNTIVGGHVKIESRLTRIETLVEPGGLLRAEIAHHDEAIAHHDQEIEQLRNTYPPERPARPRRANA